MARITEITSYSTYVIVIFGLFLFLLATSGTPAWRIRNPSASQNTGWKTLLYTVATAFQVYYFTHSSIKLYMPFLRPVLNAIDIKLSFLTISFPGSHVTHLATPAPLTWGWPAWLSGRTSVSGQRSFSVLRSTCSWRVTTYVGKPSAIGQPTRPTQPFILSGSINE